MHRVRSLSYGNGRRNASIQRIRNDRNQRETCRRSEFLGKSSRGRVDANPANTRCEQVRARWRFNDGGLKKVRRCYEIFEKIRSFDPVSSTFDRFVNNRALRAFLLPNRAISRPVSFYFVPTASCFYYARSNRVASSLYHR